MTEVPMTVHTRAVTFTDHGTDRTERVPDDEFRLGPPEVNTTERTPFTDRSVDDQDEAWRRWFQAGNDLLLLEQARDAVAAAEQASPPPVSPDDSAITYADTGFVTVRGPAFVDSPSGVPGVAVDHRILRSDYVVGPPDLGGAYDPRFRGLDDAIRDARWTAWLVDHEYEPDLLSVRRQHRYLDAMQTLQGQPAGAPPSGVDVPPPADMGRALELLRVARDDPRAKWAFLFLGLLAGGLTIGLGAGLAPGVPGNVAATAGRGGTSGNRVTVTWTRPATGPDPDHYSTTLYPTTGTAGPLKAPEADGKSTSTILDHVPDGTYQVQVVAWDTRVSGASGTTTVTVPAAPEPAVSTPPDPPTDVTLTAGMSAMSREHGLTAAWLPPAAGPAPTGYTMRLEAVNPPGMSLHATVGLMTSYFFPALRDGTYQAVVVASNATGDSTSASSPATAYAAPTLPPDAPGSPRVNVTKSATAGGNAKLVVTWTRPGTGPDVVGYQVTLTGGGRTDTTPTQTGPMTGKVYDPIDDGTYAVAVVAYNKAGKGPAATASVTVDHTTIDPNGLDWAPVFGADQVAEWKALRNILNDMDEQAEFWPHVLRVVEDRANDHGGLASYETMLFLARLLSRWIAAPAVDPPEPIIVNIAHKISIGCTPVFPKLPPPAGSGYADRMAPWRAAVNVLNAAETAQMPLRYKMFGLTRALERYLGVHA